MISEATYSELVKNCAKYNQRMLNERRARLPFHDQQTNKSQSDCRLWHSVRERIYSDDPSIFLSYPAKRWRKRPSTMDKIPAPQIKTEASENTESNQRFETGQDSSHAEKPDSQSQLPFIPPDIPAEYAGLDEFSDPEFDDGSDGDDYEDTYVKRKRAPAKKRSTGTRQNSRQPGAADDRIYSCHLCTQKYKTKPGLVYHLQHAHNTTVGVGSIVANTNSNSADLHDPPSNNNISNQVSQAAVKQEHGGSHNPQNGGSNNGPVGPFCDYCLGSAARNLRTHMPEQLITCSDCGRAGHPFCLQFTANMVISTGKYGWQCIECKSCAFCGTSENDDQLLFCDDCDKGYHMYCLKPALTQPPDGNWSCQRCLSDFGEKASAFQPKR